MGDADPDADAPESVALVPLGRSSEAPAVACPEDNEVAPPAEGSEPRDAVVDEPVPPV